MLSLYFIFTITICIFRNKKFFLVFSQPNKIDEFFFAVIVLKSAKSTRRRSRQRNSHVLRTSNAYLHNEVNNFVYIT